MILVSMECYEELLQEIYNLKHTLSDKNSSDKCVEILAWFRNFCPTNHFVRRKLCPIFPYKSQAKIGQNCRNFSLVSKILSNENFLTNCLTNIVQQGMPIRLQIYVGICHVNLQLSELNVLCGMHSQKQIIHDFVFCACSPLFINLQSIGLIF